MPPADRELVTEAERFAGDIADLLHRTVADDPPIAALRRTDRVVVAPFDTKGDKTDIPLQVAGEHRLDLRIEFRCSWDSYGKFLAIDWSEFALKIPHVREALIRFDYVRSHAWAPAHVQLHAESSALGYLHAFTGTTKPPKVQELHIPTGGRRSRPTLEDVIDFAIRDLAVMAKPGWQERIEGGRQRWRWLQVNAAVRDAIREQPDVAPQRLLQTIQQASEDLRNGNTGTTDELD